jgi:hypothetical protein
MIDCHLGPGLFLSADYADYADSFENCRMRLFRGENLYSTRAILFLNKIFLSARLRRLM